MIVELYFPLTKPLNVGPKANSKSIWSINQIYSIYTIIAMFPILYFRYSIVIVTIAIVIILYYCTITCYYYYY